jgi:spermidine synthase
MRGQHLPKGRLRVMDSNERQSIVSVVPSDDSSMPFPFIYEEEGTMRLHFQIDSVQSQMLQDAPDHLVLSYTRTMMSFLMFNRSPRHISMIGLGGGSIAKWCYRHVPHSEITVIEINPHVIALRDHFHIPNDNQRFRVLCEDGADYVARSFDHIDVLIVDGFDMDGQPAELCSQRFYDHCYQALSSSGLMVVNLGGWQDRTNIARIRKSFDDQVLLMRPEDGSNRIVFACKGEPPWPKSGSAGSFLMKLRAFEYKGQFVSA